MPTYVIEVTRTYVETISETVTVKAKSLAEAELKASLKLSNLVAKGKTDCHATENDDYRPLSNQSPVTEG